MISLDTIQTIGIEEANLIPHKVSLTSASGHPLKSVGSVILTLRYHNRMATTTAVVCPQATEFLLSWTTCRDLNILPHSYPAPIASDINSVTGSTLSDNDFPSLKSKLLAEFSDVFDESGPLKTMTGPPMSIELVSVYKPFALSNARPIPLPGATRLSKFWRIW